MEAAGMTGVSSCLRTEPGGREGQPERERAEMTSDGCAVIADGVQGAMPAAATATACEAAGHRGGNGEAESCAGAQVKRGKGSPHICSCKTPLLYDTPGECAVFRGTSYPCC